jgi:tellurite resistance protein TerC
MPEVSLLMNVPAWMWGATLGGLALLLIFDFFVAVRTPHEPSMREAGLWTGFYVGLAVLFGLGVLVTSGTRYGGEFFAGWITEYSLSIDNLFVFVIIMARFSVPRDYQQKVLLIGIILALVMRGGFIAAGAAAISRFSWIFYIFGAFLIYTAWKLATQHDDGEDEYSENVVIRQMKKVVPTTSEFDGAKLFTRIDGKRFVTPMLVVMVAIGTTDLLFALDSIPAIFGLTQEPFLVFTANAFALMGLRQLYFLIGGLLSRLIYLSYGLSIVLGFIGIKLILEALHENNLPFLNGGEHFSWAPQVPIWLSLTVIIGTLAVTTVLSLVKVRRDPEAAVHTPDLGAPPVSEDSEPMDTDSLDARGAEAPAPVPDDHRER